MLCLCHLEVSNSNLSGIVCIWPCMYRCIVLKSNVLISMTHLTKRNKRRGRTKTHIHTHTVDMYCLVNGWLPLDKTIVEQAID